MTFFQIFTNLKFFKKIKTMTEMSRLLDRNNSIDYNVTSWDTERARQVGATTPQNTTGGGKVV